MYATRKRLKWSFFDHTFLLLIVSLLVVALWHRLSVVSLFPGTVVGRCHHVSSARLPVYAQATVGQHLCQNKSMEAFVLAHFFSESRCHHFFILFHWLSILQSFFSRLAGVVVNHTLWDLVRT